MKDKMDEIVVKREYIYDCVKSKLKEIPVAVSEDGNQVLVSFQELLICGVKVEPEFYTIFNASDEWQEKTTYACNTSDDGTWFYYVDSADEVISEIYRLVIFEATKNSASTKIKEKRAEELWKYVTLESFKQAYSRFIDQADQNAKTSKGIGSRTPYGFAVNKVYGCNLTQHFGQGGASKTPYLNWHVVSIYYLPDSGKIVVGIEENRYAHIKEMQPKRYTKLGGKTEKVAVFYETLKDSLDYGELYQAFVNVCDEVFRLGLE